VEQPVTPWYRRFFSGLALEFWAEALPPAHTLQEVALLQYLVGRELAGLRIVDYAAGNGRVVEPLLQHQAQVVAVEQAPEQVAQLQALARGYTHQLEVVDAPYETAELSGQFDAAICLGNSFNYLPLPEATAWWKRIGEVVKPGGILLLHTGMLAESILPNFVASDWYEAGGVRMLVRHEYELSQSCLVSETVFLREGEEEHRLMRHYVYTAARVVNRLQAAGFQGISFFSDTDQSPFELGDPEAYIVATKA